MSSERPAPPNFLAVKLVPPGGAVSTGGDLIGPGRVVLIVGPSGSGKDTLLRLARMSLQHAPLQTDPRVVFPGRIVTRASDTPEEISTTALAFEAARAQGDYALSWEAHGLAYAIPTTIDLDVTAGRTVVLNASRTVLGAARARYTHVAVVLIDAPTEVRAQRLASRGREASGDVVERLARVPSGFAAGDADLVIHNTADPATAAATLADYIAAQISA